MKLRKALALSIALQLLLALPAGAATAAIPKAPSSVAITVNGHATPFKHPSLVVQGRTYVSADDLAAILHGTVQKNGEVITLQVKGKQVSFKLNKNEVMIAKEWKKTDQGAVLRNHVVYLPLRWVVESNGLQVKWDPIAKEVNILVPSEFEGIKVVSKDDLTKEEQDFVTGVKKTKGIHKKGNLYVIARGESPNPGYGLSIVGTEQSWEQLKVYVKMTKPEPGLMYPQVIAYPYVMARIELPPYTTVSFINADTKKLLFEE